MKKVLILACAALTACTNDIDLGPNKEQVETLSNAIGFQMAKKNMTTTKATEALNVAGHYNFGVWGYKAVTAPAVPTIMENYLVGYYDAIKGYDTQRGSTFGDQTSSVDGKSYWMYEGMGYSEYTGNYAGSAITDAYKSNIDKQYLRYWDQSATSTKFFAYAPYLYNTDVNKRVKFEYANEETMTLPLSERKVEKGEDESLAEYMVATQEVTKANYNNDVQLHFRRLNAKVNIKFYETIEGYNVKIKNLKSGVPGVTAVPAVASTTGSTTTYTYGNQYKSIEVKVKFNGINTTTGSTPLVINYQHGTATKYERIPSGYMIFTAPSATDVCSAEGYISGKGVTIGSTVITDSNAKENASKSPSTYFVIPKQTGDNSGLTFHVTYELTALQTDEIITVHNATVHVPAANCGWEAGKAYTYIFKITKNSNGSTDPDKTIDPTDPTPDTDKALYPIVFDGCTVIAWDTANESDHDISKEGDTHHYYMSLSGTPLTASTSGSLSITANKDGSTAAATVSAGSFEQYNTTTSSWEEYSGSDLTLSSGSNSITVGAGITAGKYRFNWKEGDEVVASAEFTVS